MDDKQFKVLLIEDNPGDVRLIREMLAEAGGALYDLECADWLQTGLERLAKGGIDVLLLDLGLPDSQGLDTLGRVLAESLAAPAVIVVLTGLDDETLAVQAVGAGAQDYLVKGQVEGNLLVRALRYAIERQRAEGERELLLARIREQARQVQQIVDTVPEGMLLLDADLRVALANPLAREYLAILADANVGDTLTQLGGRPLAELLTSPPQGLWHEVEIDGPPHGVFEMIARPMEAGPENEGWVLVIRDVTREREIQQRIQQRDRLAAVGQLAAGIAHDFNNIMAVIVLYTHMALRRSDVPPKVRERLTTIDRQATRATDLVQQILDFSRRAVLERRPMDLVTFLKEQVSLLERTLPESIKIGLTYGMGEHMVNADPTRMQQVIMNLALNARDAMPEGGELHIGLERIGIEPGELSPLPEMEAGEWVRVTVTDTGTGIPPDVLPRIFEPFFTTRAPLGTGLGLAQVYGIVKQHEGHVDVTTKVGEGTTFVFYLPALPVSQPEEPRLSKMPDLLKGQGETHPGGRRQRRHAGSADGWPGDAELPVAGGGERPGGAGHL